MLMFLASLFFSMPCLVHAKTLVSGESKQLVRNTFEPMQPVIQAQPILPTSRPDQALAYPNKPVSITLPVPKPLLEDVFPISTATVSEMIQKQTGLSAVGEVQLSLRAGEGIGALLRRGGYDPKKISAAVNAIADKASLRRLQICTKFQITDKGFRFIAKPGRDLYVIQHPDSGWLALTALRPIDSYVSFFQGAVKGSIYKSAMAAGVSESAYTEYVRSWAFRWISNVKFVPETVLNCCMKLNVTALMASVLVGGCITPALFCRIEVSDSFVMTRPMMSSAGMIKRVIPLHEL